jgi:hypothetical protein
MQPAPLFNQAPLTGTKNDGVLGYTSYSKERWKAAEDAAFAVISKGVYSLNIDNSTPGIGFRNLFTMRYNNEYVFQLMRPTGNSDLEALF